MGMLTTQEGVAIIGTDGSRRAQPIVFHHGWPFSGDDWDAQMLYPTEQGCGVIAHDRRGHGRSAQMSDGHHMDRLAANVAEPVVNSTLKIYEKFPHGMCATRADVVDPALLAFIPS